MKGGPKPRCLQAVSVAGGIGFSELPSSLPAASGSSRILFFVITLSMYTPLHALKLTCIVLS